MSAHVCLSRCQFQYEQMSHLLLLRMSTLSAVVLLLNRSVVQGLSRGCAARCHPTRGAAQRTKLHLLQVRFTVAFGPNPLPRGSFAQRTTVIDDACSSAPLNEHCLSRLPIAARRYGTSSACARVNVAPTAGQGVLSSPAWTGQDLHGPGPP